MQLNRSNFLRFLLQSEPGKPAISNGLRAAFAFGVPMLIGQLINQRESGLLVGLMAHFVNLANVGGPYQIKAKTMAQATLGITASVFVGTLVAQVPVLAVVLTLIWGLACGFASLYGNAGANVGLVVGISFITTIAQPGNLEVALVRSLLCLIAGGWAMLLSLVMWPFRPYDPIRLALADCLNAIANYIQAFVGKVATAENIFEIRKALETARTALGTLRIGQLSRSWMNEPFLLLIQDGDRLLGLVIALTELLETHFQQQQYYTVQQLVDDALAEISGILQAIAKVISRKPASIDLGNLKRIYEALKEQESLQRKAIAGSETDYTTLVALSNLVLMIEKLIKQLQYTAQTAKSLADRSKMSQRDIDRLLLFEDEQRSLLSLLKENLTLDSAIFRHALRIGVSLTVGVIHQ
ncbi:FUSC family membrane protein [Nostoc sp.]|uniref:FUSC family membrane protein n=1 Tax=Nostoc sp. TaxID=1180 RepID=UPI002FFB97FA